MALNPVSPTARNWRMRLPRRLVAAPLLALLLMPQTAPRADMAVPPAPGTAVQTKSRPAATPAVKAPTAEAVPPATPPPLPATAAPATPAADGSEPPVAKEPALGGYSLELLVGLIVGAAAVALLYRSLGTKRDTADIMSRGRATRKRFEPQATRPLPTSIPRPTYRYTDWGPGPVPTPTPLVPAATPEALLPPGPVTLESVTIRNFRSIADMTVDLSESSDLGGNWTCIAGLNGAGKSSVLQAICLLLLGERLTAELGQERLRRLWRKAADGDHPPELTGRCRIGNERFELYLPLSEEGVDRARLAAFSSNASSYPRMDAIWRRLQTQLMASYGATRNLSNYPDRRYASLSQHVQRQMTLFDPLTQIANVDVLLQGGREVRPALETLHRLLRQVLSEMDLGRIAVDAGNKLNFSRNGAALETLDLPDGFRSVVAWLADLCAAWHQTQPRASTDPTEIAGLVMVDEIDLHLHASLQRSLVPSLRKALPKVQFVVTTHSPLILSCFDRRELVILDSQSDTGIRELDRQLFGMSMDDIYRWLMGTRPESPVIEDMLRESDPKAAVLLEQSPQTSEAQAAEQLADRRAFLERMKTRRAFEA